MRESIEAYLHTAAEQIRWRRARPALEEELRDHLLSQKEACMACGMEEADAEAEAVRQMGDPVIVGRELDRVHRPKPQWGMLALAGALFLLGTALRLWVHTSWERDALFYQLPRTALSLLLGGGALLGGYFLDISFVGKHAGKLYIGAVLGGLLLLWRGAMANVRPYYLAQITMLFPVAFALAAYSLRGRGKLGFWLTFPAGAALAWLDLAAVDIASLVILLTTGGAVLRMCLRRNWFRLSGRWPTRVLAALSVLCGACVLYVLLRTGRLQEALWPERDRDAAGFLGVSARELLRASRWWGHGGEVSVPRALVESLSGDYLPLNYAYLLGRGPILLLCGAVIILLIWAAILALRQENALGRLISMTVVLSLGQQMLWSLLANLGTALFETSMPLVTGLINSTLDMALLGLLLSCFRNEALPETLPAAASASGRRRVRWDGGLLTIDLRK